MASKIQICNMALAQLGRGPIQDIDGTDEESIACKAAYDLVYETLLSMAEWNFATKTATLNEVDTYDFEDYDYAYIYPPDCLVAREILNTSTDDIIEFRVVLDEDEDGKLILTDEDEAVLRYTIVPKAEGMLSAAFTQAFVVRLAMAMCPKLVSGSDPALMTRLQNYFQTVAWPDALKADGIEGFVPAKSDNPIIEARE